VKLFSELFGRVVLEADFYNDGSSSADAGDPWID
jgi:hypothetical protein